MQWAGWLRLCSRKLYRFSDHYYCCIVGCTSPRRITLRENWAFNAKTRKGDNCDALQLAVTRRYSFSRPYQVWSRSLYPFLTYNNFTADTVRHSVTLTADLLTLNVCSVPAVTWSTSGTNCSEIKQSAAEL